MKKIILILSLIYLISPSFSQKISNVDYTLIEKEVKDSTSFYYYPRIIELFNKNIELTPEEYVFLYYGNVYYENYNPYGGTEYSKSFEQLVREKKYREALPLGEKSLEMNPVDLDVLYNMLVCYHYLEIKDSARIYANKYYTFIDVIIASGDGKSIETAFVVNCVNDEYQITNNFELQVKGQALLNDGPTDLLYINTKGQKKVKGQKKITEVYFNISKYWDSTAKMIHESFEKEKENKTQKDTLQIIENE
jgi:tetratricopeptide (TPR) repeat protein